MSVFENHHWLDVAIVIILGFSTIMGLRSGLIRQVLLLLTYAAAIAVTFAFHDQIAAFLTSKLEGKLPANLQILPNVTSYGGTFLLVFLSLTWFTSLFRTKRRRFRQGSDGLGLSLLNRLLGGALAFVVTAVLLGTALSGLATAGGDRIEPLLSGSELRGPLVKGADRVIASIPQEFKEKLTEAVARFKPTTPDADTNSANEATTPEQDATPRRNGPVISVRPPERNTNSGEPTARRKGPAISLRPPDRN